MASIHPHQLSLFPIDKRCSKCGETKALDAFGKHRGARDGLQTYCKACDASCAARKRAADPEKYRAILRKSADRHRARRNEECRQWYQRNKDHHRAYRERYHQAHLEKMRAYNKEWRSQHATETVAYAQEWRKGRGLEILRAYHQSPHGQATAARNNHTRRTRTLATKNTLTGAEWTAILEEQGHICLMCQRPFCASLKPSMDHRVPLCRGGGLTRANVVALCRSCNARKRDRPLERYLPQ